MVRIKKASINVTKNQPVLFPPITHLDTRSPLPRFMFPQRLNYYAWKQNFSPAFFRLRLPLNITHPMYPTQSIANLQDTLFQINIAPM